MWAAAPAGSPISCRQSKQVTRSKSLPVIFRQAHLEAGVLRYAVRFRVLRRLLDGARMEVVADELGLGERLGHQHLDSPRSAP